MERTKAAISRPMMSPLQLERYFLKELRYGLNPGFELGPNMPRKDITVPSVSIGVMYSERNPENPRQWMFEVLVDLQEPEEGKFPYKVQATLVGFFTVSDRYPEERVERLAKTNGPALLYSSAREIIASVTGCSPYPQLILPAVTFLQPEKALPDHKPTLELPPPKKARQAVKKPAAKKR
jgi:preprotein translocase subunit SecB